MQTAPSSWVEQQTLRGIGSNRTRLYVDYNGDLYGQFENNTPKKIVSLKGAGASSVDSVPIGAVFQWIGGTAPLGYLMCDGSPASQYPQLAALLASWGGRTPDLRGRYVIGASNTTPSYTQSFPGPLTMSSTGGDVNFSVEITNLPAHSHTIESESAPAHTHDITIPNHAHITRSLTDSEHSHTFDGGTIDTGSPELSSGSDWNIQTYTSAYYDWGYALVDTQYGSDTAIAVHGVGTTVGDDSQFLTWAQDEVVPDNPSNRPHHYHDVDLSSATIGNAAELSSSGSTTDTSVGNIILTEGDTAFEAGDAGGFDGNTGSASGGIHSHGGKTGNTGASSPDPIEKLPPYVAINFIIKHD